MDWDIHHGNGIQRVFESTSKVLYISLHRYDHGNFFPRSDDADATRIGCGRGKGYTVNIPWNKAPMGDVEYITAFQRIIMPIAYEFNPELVIVAAGFDAAINDPIGHYNVTPEAYGYFTQWLSTLANGRIILCLEGGYNVHSISHSMAMCAKALLGDPLPILQTQDKKPNASCVETLQQVWNIQSKYWKSLKFNKKLPDFTNDTKIDEATAAFANLQCTDADDADGNEQSERNVAGDCSSGSSSNPTSTPDNQLPGPSSTKPNGHEKQTLMDFLKEQEGFAVYPLKDCPHLELLLPENVPKCKFKISFVQSVQGSLSSQHNFSPVIYGIAIDTGAPCHSCRSTLENWMCLLCNQVCCGRYIEEHMMMHHLETDHLLTLNKCNMHIDNSLILLQPTSS